MYFIDYPLSDSVERLHGENGRSLQLNTCSCLPPIARNERFVHAFALCHRGCQDPAGQCLRCIHALPTRRCACVRGRHYQTGREDSLSTFSFAISAGCNDADRGGRPPAHTSTHPGDGGCIASGLAVPIEKTWHRRLEKLIPVPP